MGIRRPVYCSRTVAWYCNSLKHNTWLYFSLWAASTKSRDIVFIFAIMELKNHTHNSAFGASTARGHVTSPFISMRKSVDSLDIWFWLTLDPCLFTCCWRFNEQQRLGCVIDTVRPGLWRKFVTKFGVVELWSRLGEIVHRCLPCKWISTVNSVIVEF